MVPENSEAGNQKWKVGAMPVDEKKREPLLRNWYDNIRMRRQKRPPVEVGMKAVSWREKKKDREEDSKRDGETEWKMTEEIWTLDRTQCKRNLRLQATANPNWYAIKQ